MTMNTHKYIIDDSIITHRHIIDISKTYIITDNPNLKQNDIVIYNGKPERIYKNMISDSYKVDIISGSKLSVCKKQSNNNSISLHFKLIGNLKNKTQCACGCCAIIWKYEEDICNCN
jgi:hypothetical protein